MVKALTLRVDDETLRRLERVAAGQKTTIELVAEEALLAVMDYPAPPDDDERALEQILIGVEEADRGTFAGEEEVEAVFAKYRGT
ncbi:hypothetical protein I6F21_37890 [Bradyrhizobium sp. NBAIM03]|uniref:hypothetical protein n=1 Tax=Bradyrhizobium sp. NBAIM03 TaxID=2793816 RepID=UPI001CD38CDE|nr:hypothetical protein [Bradyrhizobium sp. NBAIM03]MCA1538254.1 hypothetical protein [Bradyrhizobium sp. NBAIM03]